MYYKIHETDEGLNDLCNIVIAAYTYTRDKYSGKRILELYDNAIANISVFPLGFANTHTQYRGRDVYIFPFGNYNLFFAINETNHTITILRILYQKQNWKQLLQQ